MTTKPRMRIKSPAQPPVQKQALGFPVLLSLLLHAAVIAALVVAPRSSGGHRLAPGAVSVRLVSIPGPGPGGGSAATPAKAPLPEPIVSKPEAIEKLATVPLPEPTPAPAVKPAPPEAREPQKVVSLTPEPTPVKPKASLKKKTKDTSEIIKGAIDRIKKGVSEPQKQPSSVNAAIQRLKKKVAEGEARQIESYQPQGGGAIGGGIGPAGGGGGGNRAITMEDIYRAEVAAQIEKNWAFSKQMGGDAAGLEAKIEFKVLPSGEITDIQFTARSNNSNFDDSAYKAIVKSNPVRPHPQGISKSYVWVGMRFSPESTR